MRFLNQFESGDLERLGTDDWLVLDAFSREEPIGDELLPCTDRLTELKMAVRVGRGRFILAEDYYRFSDREVTFHRLRENEVRKETLESHIREHAVDGCPISDLETRLPDQSRKAIGKLLEELRGEQRIHLRGGRRWARWHPGAAPDD